MSAHLVTCSSCNTDNRIPADKEGKMGRCGSCHAVLPPLYVQPQQLDESSFDRFIAAYQGPVLVEFWAPWCSHCASFAPAVRGVAEKLAGKAAVVQINTQDNPVLASRFGVHGIPVIMLLKNGRVIDQLAGSQSLETVIEWFRRF